MLAMQIADAEDEEGHKITCVDDDSNSLPFSQDSILSSVVELAANHATAQRFVHKSIVSQEDQLRDDLSGLEQRASSTAANLQTLLQQLASIRTIVNAGQYSDGAIPATVVSVADGIQEQLNQVDQQVNSQTLAEELRAVHIAIAELGHHDVPTEIDGSSSGDSSSRRELTAWGQLVESDATYRRDGVDSIHLLLLQVLDTAAASRFKQQMTGDEQRSVDPVALDSAGTDDEESHRHCRDDTVEAEDANSKEKAAHQTVSADDVAKATTFLDILLAAIKEVESSRTGRINMCQARVGSSIALVERVDQSLATARELLAQCTAELQQANGGQDGKDRNNQGEGGDDDESESSLGEEGQERGTTSEEVIVDTRLGTSPPSGTSPSTTSPPPTLNLQDLLSAINGKGGSQGWPNQGGADGAAHNPPNPSPLSIGPDLLKKLIEQAMQQQQQPQQQQQQRAGGHVYGVGFDVEVPNGVATMNDETDGFMANDTTNCRRTSPAMSRVSTGGRRSFPLPYDLAARAEMNARHASARMAYPSIAKITTSSMARTLNTVDEFILILYHTWDTTKATLFDAVERAFPPPFVQVAKTQNSSSNSSLKSENESAAAVTDVSVELMLGRGQFDLEFTHLHRKYFGVHAPEVRGGDGDSRGSFVSPADKSTTFSAAFDEGGAESDDAPSHAAARRPAQHQHRGSLDMSLYPSHLPSWHVASTPTLVFVRRSQMVGAFSSVSPTPSAVRQFALVHSSASLMVESYFQLHTIVNEYEETAVLFVPNQPSASGHKLLVSTLTNLLAGPVAFRGAMQELMPMVLVDESAMPDRKPLSWAPGNAKVVEEMRHLQPMHLPQHQWPNALRNFSSSFPEGLLLDDFSPELVVFRKLRHGTEGLLGKFAMFRLLLPWVSNMTVVDRDVWRRSVANRAFSFARRHSDPLITPIDGVNFHDTIRRSQKRARRGATTKVAAAGRTIAVCLVNPGPRFPSTRWATNATQCEEAMRQASLAVRERSVADDEVHWSFHTISPDDENVPGRQLVNYFARAASPCDLSGADQKEGGDRYESEHASPACDVFLVDVQNGHVMRMRTGARSLRRELLAAAREAQISHMPCPSSHRLSSPWTAGQRPWPMLRVAEDKWYFRILSAMGNAGRLAPIPEAADVRRFLRRSANNRQGQTDGGLNWLSGIFSAQQQLKMEAAADGRGPAAAPSADNGGSDGHENGWSFPTARRAVVGDENAMAFHYQVRQDAALATATNPPADDMVVLLVVDSRCGLSHVPMQTFSRFARSYMREYVPWVKQRRQEHYQQSNIIDSESDESNAAALREIPLRHFDVVDLAKVPSGYAQSHVLAQFFASNPPAPAVVVINASRAVMISGLLQWSDRSLASAIRWDGYEEWANQSTKIGSSGGGGQPHTRRFRRRIVPLSH